MSEPEPKLNPRMDDWLKAYAWKRRKAAGGDFELHPAARRALEDEVARTFKPARKGFLCPLRFSKWLGIPQVAMATSFLLVAGLASWLLLRNRPPMREPIIVAMKSPSIADASSALVVGDKKKDVAREKMARLSSKLPLADRTIAPDNRPPGPPATAKPLLADSVTAPAETAKLEPIPALAKDETAAKSDRSAVAVLQPPTKDGLFTAVQTQAGKETQFRRQYTQVVSEEKSAPAANDKKNQDILSSFNVEQTGNRIQITDADGSIYVGEIKEGQQALDARVTQAVAVRSVGGQAANEKRSEGRLKSESLPSSVSSAVEQTPLQFLSFCVRGTCRTLNRPIEIQGRLVGESGMGDAAEMKKTQVPQSRIQGRALIGSDRKIEIDAVLVGPLPPDLPAR